jgi:hypothetical protein
MESFKAQAKKNLHRRIEEAGGKVGRAAGGHVHSDAKQDIALIKREVKPDALKRAAGGSVKHKKPHTQINIAVAPHGDGPVPAPGGVGAAAPAPLPRPAPQPIPAGGPNIGALPGGRPMPTAPGPMGPMGAKHGGKVARAAGGKVHMTAGAANGEGRLEKIKEYGAKAGVRKTK